MALSSLYMQQLEELNEQVNLQQLEEAHEKELIDRFNEKTQSLTGL